MKITSNGAIRQTTHEFILVFYCKMSILLLSFVLRACVIASGFKEIDTAQ